MKTDEVCDRPLETFGAATFGVVCGLTFIVAGKIALADVNLSIIGLSWAENRAYGWQNHPNCDQKMKNPRKMVIMLAQE